MDNSIYIMLSRQTALFRDMSMTANNIANVNTGGYRAEKMMFSDHVMSDGDRRKMAFTQDKGSYLDTREGPLESTGNPLDVAISGPGYFTVETARGVRYTRNGSFQLNQDGFLLTKDGNFVLDEAGQRIQFDGNADDIRIGEAGNIAVNGEAFANLGVVQFPNQQVLEHEQGATFRANGAPLPAENSRILHGVVEKSNVEAIRELVDMTEIQRAVGNTAKFIEVMYDLQRKANDTYAKQS